jgi:hypothetical protein
VTDADIQHVLGQDTFTEMKRLHEICGVDALGWYVTFHQRTAQHGVHIPLEGALLLAGRAFSQLPVSDERKFNLAFHAILRHEIFHFAADCMAANWELATGTDVYWKAKEKHRRRDDVLGVAAMPLREGQHAEDLVTGLVEGDTQADGLHRSRDIPAEHERRLAYEHTALPGHYVDGVHPRGVHTHDDLTNTRLGDGDVGEFENLGFPELILSDDLHRRGRPRRSSPRLERSAAAGRCDGETPCDVRIRDQSQRTHASHR